MPKGVASPSRRGRWILTVRASAPKSGEAKAKHGAPWGEGKLGRDKGSKVRSCVGWKVATEGPEGPGHTHPCPTQAPTWELALLSRLYLFRANLILNRADTRQDRRTE